MKILAIGDIHGRTLWKDIINKETETDKIVFIGDYFDTHYNISAQQQKDNFKDIISFKKANMEKVILLVGNHDYHYLPGIEEHYSGYQEWQKTDIGELLSNNLDILQMCYIQDNFLFSHAGISKTWLNNHYPVEPIESFINDLFKFKPQAFSFRGNNMYGDSKESSPIWIREASLNADKLDNYIQIVGHTTKISLLEYYKDIWMIDTLGTSQEYLIIENNIPSKRTI